MLEMARILEVSKEGFVDLCGAMAVPSNLATGAK